MKNIQGYHAHLYFDASTFAQAEQLALEAGKRFGVAVGRRHRKPAGPHPMWSCQLAFLPELFESVVPWLSLHRQGMTVFVHPETGDFLKDHIDHALWMGEVLPLKLH